MMKFVLYLVLLYPFGLVSSFQMRLTHNNNHGIHRPGKHRSSARLPLQMQQHHHHPQSVDMDTLCMMNLAEYCSEDEQQCSVEDRDALCDWMVNRARMLEQQAMAMKSLARKLAAAEHSDRDVQSLIKSIGALLYLENNKEVEPYIVR